MIKTCGKQSGMSPKLANVIEYKIDEIQSVYRGTVVNMVILDADLHILYHSGVDNSSPNATNNNNNSSGGGSGSNSSGGSGGSGGGGTLTQRGRFKRGISNVSETVPAFTADTPPAGNIGASGSIRKNSGASTSGIIGENAAPTVEQQQQQQQQQHRHSVRVNFSSMGASKRKSSQLPITSTEDLQNLVRSFKQSSDAFARSLKDFKESAPPHAIHMSGHSHIFSFFDGGQVSLGFYTKLTGEQIAHFDFGSVNKSMQQILEELNVLLSNALGMHRPNTQTSK